MASRYRSIPNCFSWLHERLAYREGQVARASSDRVAVKRQVDSHKILARPGWPDYVFAFHDNTEIGPRMLARIAKRTGLEPDDL